jgi:hypothetical protein
MDHLDRRGFLKAVGLGSVAAAGVAGIPLAQRLGHTAPGTVTFRAAGGLPEAPLPAYATHIVDGAVDVAKGTGMITSRVLAGGPETTSMIGLPGLARVIRVTAVDQQGDTLHLSGLIEDRSQLHKGESAKVGIVLDRKRGVVRAPFLGRNHTLKLEM